jgi:serine/threonine protein kinase
MALLVNNKYLLNEQIGIGSFGAIYKGTNIRTKQHVAIKVEPIKNNTKLLKNESIVYQYLLHTTGIPSIKWFGKDKINYYMVINLLGESLHSIVERKGGFSLKITIKCGLQILLLVKSLHEKGLIHRDVKPDNFLLGLNNEQTKLNIIDFGFCKSFISEEKHIPFKKTSGLIGSANYASINAHNFIELSRRDDLESLGYILIYLYFGNLKWYENESNDDIKNTKINIVNDDTIPEIIIEYIKNVRSLEFEEKPNYSILIDMFNRKLMDL